MASTSLDGRKYFVSGGARGIGLSICETIVAAGGHVAILDVLPTAPPECRKLIDGSGRCHYFTCDITTAESLELGFSQGLAALGGSIDGCITNAGIGTDKPFLEHTWADFERVTKVNQAGTFFLAQLTVRQLLSQPVPETSSPRGRGSIVMIASAAASGKCPGHFLTAYGGTKGFVKSFCMQLSHELAGEGVRVNCISPGYIETELNLNLAKVRPEVAYYFNEAPPMKHIGQPQDVANGVLYLLSDIASYVTGHDLKIDGGISVGTGLTK